MQDLSKMSTEELLAMRQRAAQQNAPQPIAPVDPRIQPQVQRDQAQANVAVRTTDADVQKAIADARRADAEARLAEMDLQRGPQQTATEMEIANKEAGLNKRAGVIREQMQVVRDLYERNIKGQPATRLFGLAERVDAIPSNEEFRVAAENILPLIRPLVAQTAREGDSDREMQIFMSYIPTNDDSDITIEQKLKSLERLVDGMVGGKPVSAVAASPSFRESSPQAAGVGATEAAGQLPEGYQGTLRELERSLYQGAITPEQYAAGRMSLDRDSFGPDAQDKTFVYMEEAYQRQQLFNQGVTPDQLPPVQAPTRELSSLDQFRNNFAASPVGTGAINALDAGAFGGVSALAGDQMAAANDLNPNAALLGQIAGSIGGTAGLGALGRNTVGAALPRLTQGGAKAQLARNIGTDAAYGTIYGANTGLELDDAALSSVVGSVGGNLGAKALGKVASGVNVDPAVQYLKGRNIPLTTGQTVGGVAKGIEDRMAGLPFVGDMVNARRLEGLQAFNREAFDEAGRPIGFTPQRIGSQGLADLQGAQGQAYDAATQGFRQPLDTQYRQDMADIQQLADRLPPDALPAFDQLGENYVMPVINAREMTGDIFQNTQRAMKIKRGKPPTSAAGFEDEWRDAVSAVSDANRNFVNRTGGENVVRGLDNADRSYRLGKIVETASGRGKAGSQSGEVRTFTPFQLQGAVEQSQKKFPGVNPLAELADQGQRVLPSRVPDSGTAGRLATLALPGAVGGTGAGLGYAAGGAEGVDEGVATSGAIATALLLLGTKGGQKALNAALASRPEVMGRLGRAISGRSGIFGSAGVPLALESSR